MKKTLFLIVTVALLMVGCNSKEKAKNELDYISFDVPVETMIDSLKTAIYLLNQMDNKGNGATCFVVDGKLHHSREEEGFGIIDLTENSLPTIPALGKNDSKRLYKLVDMLVSNKIHSMGKRLDGTYSFRYKQNEHNPYHEFKQSRTIIYLTGSEVMSSSYFKNHVILDRVKKLILVAPLGYDEPKLPMDKESIMKRTEEQKRKREQTE